MPVIDIKGVGKAQFPDEMPINDIKTFLHNKYYQDVAQGNSRALDPQPQTATNVNPSLIETAGQKVSDYLFDQGIISDRYRAQEVGKSIAGLGEFLPVLGDATAGDDFGKAAAQGDKLGMGVGLLGAVPVLGDVAKNLVRVTHGSNDFDFNGNIRKANYNEPFDGVFASYGENSDYGGKKQISYDIEKEKIASGGDSDLDYDQSIQFLKSEYPDADDSTIETMYELTAEDANIYNYDTNPFDSYGYEDLGEASWQAQNLRGLIAANQGFDAIEMSDEFGTSILIPYGSKAKPITNNTNNSVDD